MPFSLFQRNHFSTMYDEPSGHLDYVKVYVEDVLAHSNSIEKLEIHLSEVKKNMRENNAEINFQKSSSERSNIL